MAIHASILAWRIPWTEEQQQASPWGCKESEALTETEKKLLTARIQRGKRINWDYEIDCGTDKKVLGLDIGYNCITL